MSRVYRYCMRYCHRQTIMSTCQDCPHFLATMDCSRAQKTLISSVQTLYLYFKSVWTQKKNWWLWFMYPKIIYVTNDVFLFCLSCSVFVVIVASLLVTFRNNTGVASVSNRIIIPLFALVPTFSPNSRRNKLAKHARQTAKSSFKFFFSRDIFIGFSNSVATNC